MSDVSIGRPAETALAAGPSAGARRMHMRPMTLFPVLLFLLSLTINLAHVDSTEFHPDETRWINRAHYLPDLADPFGPTWQDQYLTRGQPPLGSYLMGLGLLVQGRDTATNGVWDFAYGADWNEISGAMPDAADLTAARRTNAVVGALTVAVVFVTVGAISGLVAATSASLLLALHPLHIWISSQALSDQLLILLIALSLLAAIRLAERPTRGSALALGVLLGLGGATKLSPMLLAFPIAIYGAALLVLASRNLVDRAKAKRLGPLLLIQPIIALGTFVVTYPYLWPSPIRRTWNLFQLRAQEMDEQAAAWPDVGIDTPFEAIERIYSRLTWQYSTTGNLVEGALRWLGIDTGIWGIDLPLAIIGCGVLAVLVYRRGLTSGTALAAFIGAGQVGAIVVGMKVDFYRYHLPVVLAVVITGGLGVQLIWQYLADRGAATVWNAIPGVEMPGTRGRTDNTAPAHHESVITDSTTNRSIQTGPQ